MCSELCIINAWIIKYDSSENLASQLLTLVSRLVITYQAHSLVIGVEYYRQSSGYTCHRFSFI